MMSRLEAALEAARDTKRLELGTGALVSVAEVFGEQFGPTSAVVIADANTFQVAGREVVERLRCPHFVIDDPKLYAEFSFVEVVQRELAKYDGSIPIAVGSGTINDLTKLAAHRLGRKYMCVATAASMDGYTAYGASITYHGSKQTFDCPAPRAVVADMNVIAKAPRAMTASGYADLLAKVTAGADWIVSDALGIEPVDQFAWETVQSGLRAALATPVDVAQLTEGLMMGGFAMQAMQSSRPASGAEHQFSHLWDMQHATEASHGFKVGVGTLAVTRFYERLFAMEIDRLDVEKAVVQWPDWGETQREISRLFDQAEIRDKAIEETRAKWIDRDALREQLSRLRKVWPELREKLAQQLMPSEEIARRLSAVGAPTSSEQIGISSVQLQASFRRAYYIRRRFTVLDLAARIGAL
jgi:glycerol-1-phosphate dehydrogenase [NAD(P)+]